MLPSRGATGSWPPSVMRLPVRGHGSGFGLEVGLAAMMPALDQLAFEHRRAEAESPQLEDGRPFTGRYNQRKLKMEGLCAK